MKTLKLRDDFYWAGIVDDTLKVFDIIMYTEFGTTYNSYVLKSGGKVVLFETVKEAFFEEWMDKLGELIDVTRIDYLVVFPKLDDFPDISEKSFNTPYPVNFTKYFKEN